MYRHVGAYDPLSSLHQLYKARATDFARSKTSRLHNDMQAKRQANMPGPGSYETTLEARRREQPSAVFQSSVSRQTKHAPVSRPVPTQPPRMYDRIALS
jgi:hypothetical protein